MTEFKRRVNENREPQECDCCCYAGRIALFKDTMVSKRFHGQAKKDVWLCEVCASTHLSIAFMYPEQCSDPGLYKSVAVIANMILEEIRAQSQ